MGCYAQSRLYLSVDCHLSLNICNNVAVLRNLELLQICQLFIYCLPVENRVSNMTWIQTIVMLIQILFIITLF